MHIRIIRTVNGELVADNFETDDLVAAMAARGYQPDGARGADFLRPELRGKPSFTGLHGPMFDGHTPEGRPVVRYEDAEAYAALSC